MVPIETFSFAVREKSGILGSAARVGAGVLARR
jgi:hypothetical protein